MTDLVGRGRVPGLMSPQPIFDELPGIYETDEFLRDFTWALDEVLAPVFMTLDCLDAYVDPWLAPPDFLPWLADWLDIGDDEHWDETRRRRFLANAGTLFKERGTRRGLHRLLELAFDVDASIEESGGSVASTRPRSAPPGAFPPWVRVTVPASVHRRLDDRTLREVAAFAVPAHVTLLVDVLGDEPGADGGPGPMADGTGAST